MSELHFPELDPDKGYVTTHLLVPKKFIEETTNRRAITNDLTFLIGDEVVVDENGAPIAERPRQVELWDETANHLVLPREFFTRKMREEFTEEFGVEWVEERLESNQVNFHADITPRDAQTKALRKMWEERGGTVNLGCGKGKTVLALIYAIQKKVPILVVVEKSAVLEQWKRSIKTFLGEDVEIGHVQGSTNRWKGCPITLAMVQTLANRRDELSVEFRRYFGVVFFDEGHHMAALHFLKAADIFYGERFSLTATPFRNDGMQALSMYHIGDIIYSDISQDLIPETLFHKLEWEVTKDQDLEARDVTGTVHHRKFCCMLGTVDWRNNLIMQHLKEDMDEDRQILVLSHSVEHTRRLGELASKYWKTTGVVNAEDVKPKDRIPLLENANPVIATMDLAREALDKPELDTLYVTTPFGDSNGLQQSWGRIQRSKEGKKDPRVRAYEDLVHRPPDSSRRRKVKDNQIRTGTNQCRGLKTYLKALKYPYRELKETTPWNRKK